jgi:hypothetical protein
VSARLAACLLALGAATALFLPTPLPAQERDTSVADVDGPYLFEDGDGWTAKRVLKSDKGAAASVEKLSAKAEFDVPLPGRKPLKVRVRPASDPPPTEIAAPDSLMALSDLEGEVDRLIALLRAGKVVDEELQWTFGKGHLVVVGDTFDRGLHVTECLWLFYELEERARAAGGAVHFLLGNHDVMCLTGDLRYVRRKYFENAKLLGEEFVGLYGRRTLLGRWLRSRNAAMRIGDEIFVHGGISPAVARKESDLGKLNGALRTALAADDWNWKKPPDGLLRLAAGSDGLLWYRGYIHKPISEAEMDEVLTAMKAKRVVVGHTLVDQIGLKLGGRVLALDVKHAAGTSQAAVRDKDGEWRRLLPDGTREKL